MLHSYKDLGSIFCIPVFTTRGGLSLGLYHVTFVAFDGSSHLTCFGCIFWLEQSLVSMVRNKNMSHCKANTATPDFSSACFGTLPRGLVYYRADPETHSRDAPTPEYQCWQCGEQLAKTRIHSQGQWCGLIQLERLSLLTSTRQTFWNWYVPVMETVPKTKAENSIPDLHSLHVRDSYLWWHKMSFIITAVY